MKILALEASTRIGGAALISEERLVSEHLQEMSMAHAERLLALADRVLNEAGLTARDLDALAVSVGPGSFTGLRVAVNTVKGWAAGRPLPVAAVPTLEALAWNLPAPGSIVCPMMDARKGEVYSALFSAGPPEGLRRVSEDEAVRPELLAERLSRRPERTVVLIGDGAHLHRTVFETRLGVRAVLAPAVHAHPRPSVVGWLGRAILLAGKAADVRTLEPSYIRRSDAEVNWDQGVRPKPLKLKRPPGAAKRP